MNFLSRTSPSSAQRKIIQQLLKKAPSPSLAQNYLLSLIDSGGATSIKKISATYLPDLIRLLGSSTYLCDVLIRQGKYWPELFLRQIKINQKTFAEHLAELGPRIKSAQSDAESCACVRQHKQRD